MTESVIPINLNEYTAGQLASLFDALSDPTRLRIIAALLEGEMNVGDLVECVGLSKSAVSHQLRSLRDKRLVRSRKQGRQVYVALDDDHVADLFQRGLDQRCMANRMAPERSSSFSPVRRIQTGRSSAADVAWNFLQQVHLLAHG
jgi:DNA-binding transcriptional ArsR family regulator